MKILFFCLYGRSGGPHYVSQIANPLSRRKNNVYVILPDYSITHLFDKKIKLIKIKAPPSILKTILLSLNPLTYIKIVKKIREINPDVIHFTDNHPWYLMILPYLKRYKLVVTQHDVISHQGEKMRGKITNHVNVVLNRAANKIVVHGKILKEMLIKKGYPESKIIVMYQGGLDLFLKWAKKGVKLDKNHILFFGRILKYKGLDTLLQAMPLIKQKISNIKLTIAGEGNLDPYQEYLTEEIKDNLEIINKYFDEKEVAPLFQKASLVIMPYNEASQSGLVLLSYAFKKPLISTSVGAIPEVVDDGKTGILIPPHNPKILAEKVVELLNDEKKMLRLGENGYKKMKTFLNWEVQTQILAQTYEEILADNKEHNKANNNKE